MILKLLSTVRQVTYEDSNGVVMARMYREPDTRDGKVKMQGTVPERPHFQAVHYWNGTIDRSMRTPQTAPALPA